MSFAPRSLALHVAYYLDVCAVAHDVDTVPSFDAMRAFIALQPSPVWHGVAL